MKIKKQNLQSKLYLGTSLMSKVYDEVSSNVERKLFTRIIDKISIPLDSKVTALYVNFAVNIK